MMLAAVTRLEVAPKVRGKYNGFLDRYSSAAKPQASGQTREGRRAWCVPALDGSHLLDRASRTAFGRETSDVLDRSGG